MNLRGIGTALSMIYLQDLLVLAHFSYHRGTDRATKPLPNGLIYPSIASFIEILAIGVLCGGLAYTIVYLKKSYSVNQ